MAINPADITYSIVRETVEGTMPTTGSLLRFANIPGTMPTYVSDVLNGQTLRPKRGTDAGRKINYRVEGGLEGQFKRDPAMELLLMSALSAGEGWTEAGTVGVNGDTLKASDKDVFFTVEKRMPASGGGSTYFERFKGCQVTNFSLDISSSEIAKASATILGMGRDTATSATALTYAASSTSLPLTGLDVGTLTIGNLTGLAFRSLSFSIAQTKETRDVFGSANPIGLGTSGGHQVSFSATCYMDDLAVITGMTGDGTVPASFTIGGVGTGYTFLLPAASFSLPTESEDGSKALVTIDFQGSTDTTLDTVLQITRL